MRFEFVSGTLTVDGKPSPETAGMGWKIDMKNPFTVARLIYLTRLSDADHNMAVIAAADAAAVDRLTRAMQANPDQACTSTGESFCTWVPPRVAVLAERMTPAGKWEPVR